MNQGMLRYILGKMLVIEGIILLIPTIISIVYGEKTITAFIVTIILVTLTGGIFVKNKPKDMGIHAKEGFFIVAMVWILWSVFGALPFYISGTIPSFIDSLFETISGFTTTGSSIITNVEILPKSILFWRNLTHWIGGMGVLILVLTVVPLTDKNSMYLVRAEMPGPLVNKLTARISTTAKTLYGIYILLTIVQIFFLLAGGMGVFDAVMYSLSTVATGGFANRNASVAHFNSVYIDTVVTVFMFLCGINFNLFYLILVKGRFSLLKSEELLAYIAITAMAIFGISVNTYHLYGGIGQTMRYASFQVVSLMTTTGFYTVNYNNWPEFSKTILLIVMMIGSCAGSTGGGVKVSRVLIMAKSLKKEMDVMLHPRAINRVKMDGKPVEQGVINGVFVFLVFYVIIMCVSVLIISLDGFGFATNVSAVITMLNNVGPGISLVGPVEDFHRFSTLSKLVFSVDMLFGRLEIFPILILFSPMFWRDKF